jgi:polysaccharide export outer membrane protein
MEGFFKMIRLFFAFLLLIAFVASAIAEDRPYTLNPGDILEISVWKEEGLQREVLVLPDGTISFPLAGHIKARGRAPREIEKELVDRMRKYIPDMVVTVSVKLAAGYKVFVIGQVKQPGEYQATSFIDVMQALSRAGGLTPFAAENDIVVLRRESGKQVALPFDYGAVKRGQKLEQNIILKSGDVVVVRN